MWSFVYKMGSPKFCYKWAARMRPWAMSVCIVALLAGLVDGLGFAPADYQQGDSYRIMFIHVPAAVMSLGIYSLMATSAVFFLIWKIKVSDIIAQACAPLGALFALLTLITGSLWGKPTWGTFWIWDARLTSELILLFIYLGIIALRTSMPTKQAAAKATAVMTIIGMVNIPIIHYSVYWWNTLHQGATILKLGKPEIASAMLYPLLWMLASYAAFFIWVLAVRVQTELLHRERKSQWVQTLLEIN